jgi:hypothetical protein
MQQATKKGRGGNRPGAGRPKAGGTAQVSAVRFPEDMAKAIEQWAEDQGIGRSEAIRRLVELGLKAKGK